MARRLGLVIKQISPAEAEAAKRGALAQKTTARSATPPPDSGAKVARSNGSRYYPSPEHSGLATFIADVCENPAILAEFLRNPELTSATHANLTQPERAALLSMHSGRIRMAIKHASWSDPRVQAVDATRSLHAPPASS
ncbi:hypothetical protein AWV80_26555 [Cupriavidus sp. UYMU48A]|nr:hypothetical protein AWV80_26555 [Cupriavidus sp. UYMU48A]